MLTLKSDRAIRILRLLTGIEEGTHHKLKEIAAEYNVTPERIRQIKFKALRKLKLICERNMNHKVFDIEITEDNIKEVQTLMFDQFQKNMGYGWDYNVKFTTNSTLNQMAKSFDESLAINYRKRK